MDTKLIVILVIFAAGIGFTVYRVIEGQIEKNKLKKWRREHQNNQNK